MKRSAVVMWMAILWLVAPMGAGSAAAAPATIQASGTNLILNGSIYRFVGIDVYEAATVLGTNAGCGAELSDAQLNQLFASLPP